MTTFLLVQSGSPPGEPFFWLAAALSFAPSDNRLGAGRLALLLSVLLICVRRHAFGEPAGWRGYFHGCGALIQCGSCIWTVEREGRDVDIEQVACFVFHLVAADHQALRRAQRTT